MSETSANRALSLDPPWQAALAWPMAQPADVLDYSLDVSAALADIGSTLAGISVSAAPSGAGELTVNSASFSGGVITVWLAGGVPSRSYTVQIVATTADAQELTWFVALPIDPAQAVPPIPVPPSPGYGAPVVYP